MFSCLLTADGFSQFLNFELNVEGLFGFGDDLSDDLDLFFGFFLRRQKESLPREEETTKEEILEARE